MCMHKRESSSCAVQEARQSRMALWPLPVEFVFLLVLMLVIPRLFLYKVTVIDRKSIGGIFSMESTKGKTDVVGVSERDEIPEEPVHMD